MIGKDTIAKSHHLKPLRRSKLMLSEKVELLGKGLYTESKIPDVLTIKSIPTVTELEYVGSEDFDKVMLDSVLPAAIEEKINPRDLLEIDYYWICRCLRFLNYGPYYTASAIFCTDCHQVSRDGQYQVDLRTIPCNPLPKGFKNKIVIEPEQFIDYNKRITLSLQTIQTMLNCDKDKVFKKSDGRMNQELARLCYMVTSIGENTNVNPIDVMYQIEHEMSAADYVILKSLAQEYTNYGLVTGGTTVCPKCHSQEATFIAMIDDRFFRPTLGDIRQWKQSRSS